MTVYSDRDALRRVIAQRDTLSKRINTAIAIHTEDDGRCTYCRHPDGTGEYTSPAWPCPTVAALTEETP
ncbi:hypothetical protein [Brevibacterium sandarakinum]|uniref:hypothetical protein n=1 Tax=Brevibacterium sandarakinum TaxID=629680 RepID=UPI0026545C4C|nr:hypothetical protein [Brevibacterium sandarakinum]MDN5659014.1 hypothetical protein [Brevibacterium sandarakinum]